MQSVTLKWILRVFSLKFSYNFMGNVGFYSVGKEIRKSQKQGWLCILRVILRVGQVTRRVTRCFCALDSSASSIYFSCGHSRVVHSRASCEQVTSCSELHSSSPISHTNILH